VTKQAGANAALGAKVPKCKGPCLAHVRFWAAAAMRAMTEMGRQAVKPDREVKGRFGSKSVLLSEGFVLIDRTVDRLSSFRCAMRTSSAGLSDVALNGRVGAPSIISLR
jgi:hypothetical protein